MRNTMTSDIGLAIRDFCEQRAISHIEMVEEVTEIENADKIETVDVSDPNNPIFHMENGAIFKVIIVRAG